MANGLARGVLMVAIRVCVPYRIHPSIHTGYERGRPRDTKGDFQTQQCTRSGVSEAVGGLLCVLSQTLV